MGETHFDGVSKPENRFWGRFRFGRNCRVFCKLVTTEGEETTFFGTEIGLEMDPEGFKPLTGVLRSKVTDGKVRYRRGRSPVSRTGKSGITDLKVPYQFQKVRTQFDQSPVSDFKSPVSRRGCFGRTGVYQVGTQVCIGWIHRCVSSWCTGL